MELKFIEFLYVSLMHTLIILHVTFPPGFYGDHQMESEHNDSMGELRNQHSLLK